MSRLNLFVDLAGVRLCTINRHDKVEQPNNSPFKYLNIVCGVKGVLLVEFFREDREAG